VAASVYLVFRNHRTALLGCMVLLLCLYPADKQGLFDGFWLNNIIGIGEIGAHAAIVVGGLLLASVLVAADMVAVWARVRFHSAIYAWLCGGGVAAERPVWHQQKQRDTFMVPVGVRHHWRVVAGVLFHFRRIPAGKNHLQTVQRGRAKRVAGVFVF